jgi:hypothetical protein
LPSQRNPAHGAPGIAVSEKVEALGDGAYISAHVAYCGRCKRRKVVSFDLPEEVKRLLLLYRWKTGVCLACVDELAVKGAVRYRPENLEAVTWADMPERPKRQGRR